MTAGPRRKSSPALSAALLPTQLPTLLPTLLPVLSAICSGPALAAVAVPPLQTFEFAAPCSDCVLNSPAAPEWALQSYVPGTAIAVAKTYAFNDVGSDKVFAFPGRLNGVAESVRGRDGLLNAFSQVSGNLGAALAAGLGLLSLVRRRQKQPEPGI